MTLPVAPPPVQPLAQLADFVAFFRNLDAVEKLVADLRSATDEFNAASKALADANSEATDLLAKLEKQEAALDGKQAKLDAQKEDQDAKAKSLAESESNLQSAYVNHESRVAEFEARVRAKTEELTTLEGKLNAALLDAAAEKAALAAQRVELDARMKAIQAAMGA